MIAGSLDKPFHLTSLGLSFYECEVGAQWPWPLCLGWGGEQRTRDKVHVLRLDASDVGVLACL